MFAFANYVPYSKHLHIFLAFPNTYFTSFDEKGKMDNMESITTEVKIMMGMPVENMPDPNAPVSFGAKDVTNLSQKSLLDAYTCTECGRCTDNCPANLTGKKLSPRKISCALLTTLLQELHPFPRLNWTSFSPNFLP